MRLTFFFINWKHFEGFQPSEEVQPNLFKQIDIE